MFPNDTCEACEGTVLPGKYCYACGRCGTVSVEELELRIRRRLKVYLDDGHRLNDGHDYGISCNGRPYNEKEGACLVGACAYGRPFSSNTSTLNAAARNLQVPVDELDQVQYGYCGWNDDMADPQSPLYLLGQRLRAEFGPPEEDGE